MLGCSLVFEKTTKARVNRLKVDTLQKKQQSGERENIIQAIKDAVAAAAYR